MPAINLATCSQRFGRVLRSVKRKNQLQVVDLHILHARKHTSIHRHPQQIEMKLTNPKNPDPSKVAIWRTRTPAIQVHSPFHWRVQWFLGKLRFKKQNPYLKLNSKFAPGKWMEVEDDPFLFGKVHLFRVEVLVSGSPYLGGFTQFHQFPFETESSESGTFPLQKIRM